MKKILIQRPKTQPKEPTPEQLKGWLNQRSGRWLTAYLIERIEDIKDGWANGDYTGSTTEETIQLNSEAIGRVQEIAEFLVTLDEMKEDRDEYTD